MKGSHKAKIKELKKKYAEANGAYNELTNQYLSLIDEKEEWVEEIELLKTSIKDIKLRLIASFPSA